MITLFPSVWTGVGRVIRKFFHRAMTVVVRGRVCFKADQGEDKTTRWQCCTAASSDGTGTGCRVGRSLTAGDPPETRDTEPPPRKGLSGPMGIREGVYVSRGGHSGSR